MAELQLRSLPIPGQDVEIVLSASIHLLLFRL